MKSVLKEELEWPSLKDKYEINKGIYVLSVKGLIQLHFATFTST